MTPLAAAEEPILVLHPDPQQGQTIAGWLGDAGIVGVRTARTCDEAIFLLGRMGVLLLVVDDRIAATDEARLLLHVTRRGTQPPPPLVRLVDAGAPTLSRMPATETIERPLVGHEVVMRVGSAMQRPDLAGRFGRPREARADYLDTARRMQLGLLPTADQIAVLHDACGIGLAAFCRFGETVGGDFWGAWPTGRGRFALALADFAGHGLGAALNTFRLHAILAEPGLRRDLPRRMAGLLNGRLHTLLPRGHYATMVYAQIDPAAGRLAWASAGGPAPLFVHADGVSELHGRGLPLGVRPDTVYAGALATLTGPGILCLFSDGLFESGPGMAEIPRAAIAAALAGAAASAGCDDLTAAAALAAHQLQRLRDRHRCADHFDDVTAVCVAVRPGKDQGQGFALDPPKGEALWKPYI